MIGPNVKKLMAIKVAKEAIPSGGNFVDGVNFLVDKERVIRTMRDSYTWVLEAIQLVRNACEPNPYKDADDETIANVILKQIEERKSR